MCILAYLVNFALLYYAWFINKRFGDSDLVKGVIYDLWFLWNLRKVVLPVMVLFVVLICGLIAGMPQYWNIKPPANTASLHQGITENGHPWIGAKNPGLVIEEFTDYLCSQCRIKHFFLRRLIAENPGKIRLVHRHFPMDHKYNPVVQEPYHVGSGALALFSIYAQTEDKFWQANDMFFQLDKSAGKINTDEIANELEIDHQGLAKALKDRSILYHLQKDIQAGLDLNLSGTPGYLINGKVYHGHIPPGLLKEILE
jgi:protein-disulfide isomerase